MLIDWGVLVQTGVKGVCILLKICSSVNVVKRAAWVPGIDEVNTANDYCSFDICLLLLLV